MSDLVERDDEPAGSGSPATRRRRGLAGLVRLSTVLRLAIGLVVVAAAGSIVASVARDPWPDPEPFLAPSRSALADETLRDVESDGVRFTARQQDSLRRLIGLWERRADLRALLVTGTGSPDMVSLIRWANQNNDPDALQLALIRPSLSEAAARMGMLDANGDIIPVLVHTLAMRPSPTYRVAGSIWDLAEIWNRRRDIRERFSSDGVVNVRGLYAWASSVPADDPDFAVLKPSFLAFDQVLDELPPITRTGVER